MHIRIVMSSIVFKNEIDSLRHKLENLLRISANFDKYNIIQKKNYKKIIFSISIHASEPPKLAIVCMSDLSFRNVWSD